MRLPEKYKPKRLKEVVGQPQALSQLVLWFSTWKKGKPLIISGPPGTGKSAAVHALALEHDLDIVEFDEDAEQQQILAATKQRSLFGRKKLIIIEDADRFPTKFLLELARKSSFPVIFFVNDLWKAKMKNLRTICEVVQFKKLHRSSIRKKLLQIRIVEKIKAKNIEIFVHAADGDMRAALIDLDSGEHAARDRTTNIFEVLKLVFSGPYQDALNALKSADKDPKQILWWIEENIPVEFKNPKLRAKAFEILSDADYRKNKMLELLAGLCTIKKKKDFTSYTVPRYKPQDNIELCAEIAKATHSSISSVRKVLTYIKIILKHNQVVLN